MRTRLMTLAQLRRPSLLFVLALCLATAGGILVQLAQNNPAEADVDLTGPKANDRQVTLIVSMLLSREHLSKKPLDDEISHRALDTFLKYFDPMKVYFYQSDVDAFAQRRDELDDMIRKGDIKFAYTVFNRFLQRVDERVDTIDELLKQEYDFTLKEEMPTEPDDLVFPRNEAEARERWRKRIKFDLLVLKADKEEAKEGQEARDKLTRRYHSFAKRMHQTNQDDLLERFLTAVTTGFDPHTTYMSPSSLENFRILMKLNLDGIGAALQVIDGYTIVSKVIPGGAADKQGELKPEDRIVSVGQGDEGEMADVVDMRLNDVVKLIRGPAGSVVRLGVQSPPGSATKVLKITRAKIELKDSEARGEVFEAGEQTDGTPFKVGVVDLPSFYMDMEAARRGETDYKSTTRDVRAILERFKQQEVDALIVDLRRNGGGSLTEAINLTGLFIDRGPVVQVKDSSGRVQQYDDQDRGMVWDGPMVVLTSKFSASASEILAGAIQDYRRGIIVGDEATHGKGTVQSLLDLGAQLFRVPNPPNLGALKITMQQFYRPGGDSTQKRGVLADVILPSVTAHMDVGEDDLDFALEFDKVENAGFTRLDRVTEPILKSLRDLSAARLSGSEDFTELTGDIEKYCQQKDRKSVTLNEAEFLAERAELNADKEDEKVLMDHVNPDNEGIERDYYLDEVIAITLDYVKMLAGTAVVATN